MPVYCTNCGKETHHRICRSCGVKNGKINNFCYWCGSQLNPHASICINCQEFTKIQKVPLLLKLLHIFLYAFCFFVGICLMVGEYPIAGIVFILGAFFVLSSTVIKLVKKISHNSNKRKLIRTILYLLQILLICIVFVLSVCFDHVIAPKIQPESSQVEQNAPSWPIDIACAEAKSTITKEWGDIPSVSGEILYENGRDYIVAVTYNFFYDNYWVKGSIAYHVWGIDENVCHIRGRTEHQDYDYNYCLGTRLDELKAIWKIK